jgi:hypothetical protein
MTTTPYRDGPRERSIRVVRPSRAVRATAVLMLASDAVLAADAIVSPAGQGAPIAVLVVFGALGGVLAFIAFGRRWLVDASGIERRLAWQKPQRLAWGDVEWIYMQYGYFLRGRGGTPMEVGRYLEGHDAFAQLVLAHVAASKIEATTRQMLERKAGRAAGGSGRLVLTPDPPARDAATLRRWRDNPFYVLALPPECTAAEVERAGQKLLGLLAVEVASARTYATPLGPGERTEDTVRAAMAELRDPDRRVVHETWARLAADAATSEATDAGATAPAWPDGMRGLGWRRG